MKRSTLFFLGLFFLVSLNAKIHSADLHALLVGDTLDKTLGKSCRSDVLAMNKELQQVATACGLKLKVSILRGVNVTAARVLDEVNSMQITTQDVVVLYFSQHGYRTEVTPTLWPILAFGVSNNGINFDTLNQMVLARSPRFLLSIADVCNNVLKEEFAPPIVAQKNIDTLNEKMKKNVKMNYRKLFVQNQGAAILSGAIPGTVSYSYAMNGSMCTLSFLEALKNEVESSSKAVSWHSLMQNCFKLTQQRAIKSKVEQTPQFEIRTGSN